MRARQVSGWLAIVSGGLLLVAIAASALGAITGLAPANGNSPMGPGMMGFGTSGPDAPAIAGATEVRVQAASFSFSPSEIRLHSGVDVNLTFVNPAANGAVHDLTVPALGSHIVANAGETRTVGLRGFAAGRYDAYCSVPGHADLGMRATIIVE